MKIYNQLARAALLAGVAWSATACDDLASVNENPNSPEDVTAEYILPYAIRTGVGASFDATMILSHTGVFAQHVAQIQYPSEETGVLRTTTVNTFWDRYYSNALPNAQLVIDKGREEGQTPNYEAIGLIWRSWLFHQVTDLWGDTPYSEALGGAENTRPVYDAQQDVYKGLLADLTQAVSLLDPSGLSVGAADLLYGGDAERWRRFANALRMRLAMRLVNADPATAQAEFVAAYEAGGFQANGDNAALEWPGDPYENSLYTNYLGRDDHSISGAIVDTLLSLDDPRIELYAEPATADDAYRGHYNGLEETPQEWTYYSRIGNFWRRDGGNTPSMIMSYSEQLFLEAEAAERGWIAGDAAELYRDAIQANMTQYAGLADNAPTQAEIDAYLANPKVAYAGLSQIHLQQWIGLFMNTNEAWAHWRRTGSPNLTPGPDLTVSRIPVRLFYPPNEQSYNSANLAAAVTHQGGGRDLVTPLWWMAE